MEWKMVTVVVTRVKCASEAQSYKLFLHYSFLLKAFLGSSFWEASFSCLPIPSENFAPRTKKFFPSPGHGAGGIVKDLN